ncbi:TIGR01244 family sulfur transferase [Pseudoroseicyclus aestuarii]|uniref:Uncharacterized protein (TIGR01244 family) n=1 Tax=Pseudoroseicyclus aestuarii TaxID=1795041 RepID=A0A318SSA8_9RHOB|nr:TIGR01244 family sulfur transferase [Pseudoroseicyclus aestuarii]PYE81409.1 uncharacterized protein (TIGR01244 family) [Pseudoroseicyclus aestuarii]
MDIRQITSGYAVSPQIRPEEVAAIKEAGYTTIICNRPDAENPPELKSIRLREVAEAAGVHFVDNPVTHDTLGEGRIDEQAQAIEAAPGPVLAYCASGTRSSILWALSQAGKMPTDEIIGKAGAAGYDLERLRPTLDAAG